MGGQVYGATTLYKNSAGLFCSIGTTEDKLDNSDETKLRALSFTFANCVVQTGTIFQNNTTMTAGNLSRDYLIGGANGKATVGTINTSATVTVGSLD